MRAINPELTKKAEKELSKYSLDRKGLKQVLDRYGGEQFLDNAVNFANNSPKIKETFKKFGVTPDELKRRVITELNNEILVNNQETKKQTDKTESYKERLNKMR